jgi:hypothetical protein
MSNENTGKDIRDFVFDKDFINTTQKHKLQKKTTRKTR